MPTSVGKRGFRKIVKSVYIGETNLRMPCQAKGRSWKEFATITSQHLRKIATRHGSGKGHGTMGGRTTNHH